MPTKYTTPTEPVLTLQELERMKRGRDDWHPQRALAYCWARFDPIHGHGGSHYGGRPSRPGDPGYGDGWSWAGFSSRLEQDRKEIEDVVAEYREQAPRLRRWLEAFEALARRRDRDPDPRALLGSYYEGLRLLAYVYTASDREKEDNE